MPQRHLTLDIDAQPDDTACGPTCLAAVYGFFGDPLPLDRIIREVECLDEGGTLDVFLACHALERGYRATLFTYNPTVFDPTWFRAGIDLGEKLREQAAIKRSGKLRRATAGYCRYLELGGTVRMEDLSGSLIRRYLRREVPILCGLSATWLYRSVRERPNDCLPDDVRGVPEGHFVVLSGYDRARREVGIADPYHRNPMTGKHYYSVKLERLMSAILLGIVTYDANLLIIEPPR